MVKINSNSAMKQTLILLNGMKRLYFETLNGVYRTLLLYGFPDTMETVEAMKDGIIEYFFFGIDPEWETEENYLTWESLSPEYFSDEEVKKRFHARQDKSRKKWEKKMKLEEKARLKEIKEQLSQCKGLYE
jgi:adenylate kinase family enzyme